MRRYEHGGDVYGPEAIRLDFSVNTNPLGMPAQARAALAEGLDGFCRYPDPRCRALSGAVAQRFGVAAENVLCGAGASDLLFRVCAWAQARLALTVAPTFSEYERPVRLFGGRMREYRLSERGGFSVDEGLLDAVTPDVELVFLCNPNNPTGRLAEPALLARLARRCREQGAVLVADECFLPFTEGASLLPLLPETPNLLVLRAFTKLYAMAGLRLGVLLGAGELLERIADFGPEWSVSVPAQTAGLAALSAEPGWSEKTRALAAAERAFLTERLTALGLTCFPSDANFLLLRGDRPLTAALRERGLLVRDCANFTGLDETYFRIGLKTRAEDGQLLLALEEALHG